MMFVAPRMKSNPSAILILILCVRAAAAFLGSVPKISVIFPIPSSSSSTLQLFRNFLQAPLVEEKSDRIPYIIDQLGDKPSDKTFDDIAHMCIDVFFNDEEPNPPPWKQLQLAYLRSIQSSDLRRRRITMETKLAMFVARRVVPMANPDVAKNTPLIVDWDRIQNLQVDRSVDYVRGEILGFCEVSERPYGLGDSEGAALGKKRNKNGRPNTARPFLTNLSVIGEARKSGIGGKLMEACESEVASWEAREIILEVESDNLLALEFYKKRGYNTVFTDPACRRFTTNGFFLGKERCTKVCMRKLLNDSSVSQSRPESMTKSTMGELSKLFQSFQESVFN